jgi:hypothetical protein
MLLAKNMAASYFGKKLPYGFPAEVRPPVCKYSVVRANSALNNPNWIASQSFGWITSTLGQKWVENFKKGNHDACTKAIDWKSFAHFGDLIGFCTNHKQNDGDNDKYTTKYGKCDENTAGQAKSTDNLQNTKMLS